MVLRRRTGESGIILLETLVALGVLGLTAAIFVTGLATTARADLTVTERTRAESLARSQLEATKGQAYIDFSQVGHGDYAFVAAPANYMIGVTTVPVDPATGQPLPSGQDNGVQRISVTITHQSRALVTLESYKVDR